MSSHNEIVQRTKNGWYLQAGTYAKPKLNMTITKSLWFNAIWSLYSHGIGRMMIAVSRARLRAMEENSDNVRDLHEPRGTGFHSWETGLQWVKNTTKKVIPKQTSMVIKETAHRLKTGVVKIRIYNPSTANLTAVVLKIHVVDIATRTFQKS